MNTKQYAVILAGGKGERFWPLSTSTRPKQLLDLVGDKTFLAQAVDRIKGFIPIENIYIITNQELVEACKTAAPEFRMENIIGEPVGRDTAAAVALGAAIVKSRDPDGVFSILTADHIIGDLDLFQETLQRSMSMAARDDVLITIGIQPYEPSTGYGYIESGERVSEEGRISFLKANRFVEKPDRATAEQYISSGKYFWNSGMFIWSVSALEAAFALHCPHLVDLINALEPHAHQDSFEARLAEVYESLEKISIDYALMEKADNIVMVKGIFSWDDVGSWPALENHIEPDEQGNAVVGTFEGVDAEHNIVYSRDHVTTLIGVRDLIVVQTDKATLICPKSKAQDVKKLVRAMAEKGCYNEVL